MQARERFRKGEIDRSHLREVEDEAILDALRRQRDIGLDVVTDGEYRRDAWQTDISDALEGFVADYPIREQKLPDGSVVSLELHTKAIDARLRQIRRITAHESEFLLQHAGAPCKITMPSPNSVVWGSYQKGVTDRVYPTRDELRADLVPIYQAEVAALAADGVRYIQFDEGFTRYGSPGWRAVIEAQGVDPDAALAADIETENAIYDSIGHEGLLFASHLCRGSRTAVRGQGTYDDLAERLFADLHVDRFLLEDDDGQLGTYELLRFLPPEKTVVLGLVTTKYPEVEDVNTLRGKVDAAATHCSLEQLAISPQCGFGGSADNDFMPYDQQFVKLANLASVARAIWT